MARPLRRAITYAFQAHSPVIPAFFGFDDIDQLEALRKKGESFIFLDHAYFDRGYERGNFRCLDSQIHQTGLLGVPGDRLSRYCPFPRPWNRNGSKIYVIPTPPMVDRWHGCQTWVSETTEILGRCTDREIIVKKKSGAPLRSLLWDAWAVVSHSSVAAVEAAYHGVAVFGPPTSPAYQVGLEDLSRIENPIYPDREPWLKTLSYSQFSLEEIRSGEAWAIVKELYDFDARRTQNLDHELVA